MLAESRGAYDHSLLDLVALHDLLPDRTGRDLGVRPSRGIAAEARYASAMLGQKVR